jgi:hypothetical protein
MRQFLIVRVRMMDRAPAQAARAQSASAQIIETFFADGDENRRIQGNGCLIRFDEAGFARKRWLIAPKERSVGACPNMRDSSCCKFMQAADHDHALAT